MTVTKPQLLTPPHGHISQIALWLVSHGHHRRSEATIMVKKSASNQHTM